MVVCKTEYSIFWNNRDSIPFSSGNMVSRNNVKEVTNIQLGDFNGDGMADIVMNQEGESVYRIAFANGMVRSQKAKLLCQIYQQKIKTRIM